MSALSELTIEVSADVRPFLREMRRAVLSVRNLRRARRGLPHITRPLVATRKGDR